MATRIGPFLLILVPAAIAAAACSAPAQPPPHVEAPKAITPEGSTPPAVPAEASASDAGAPEKQAAPEGDASAPPAERARSQLPISMLTARDAAFLVDYSNSEVKQKAQSACETESKGDPEKQGACLTKARDKFMPDVVRFRKDSETQTSLVIYKRKASSLSELWIGLVELSEPTSDTVKVKFVNKGKGARPLWQGKTTDVVIQVPNEYSIEFDDPVYGHLRYDAKIGLVTE